MSSDLWNPFSREQVEAYMGRINIPAEERRYSVGSLSPKEALEYLALLQRHHLVSVPFENLDLHYSQHHSISLNKLTLFRKIVQTPGRGGYCLENNGIFGTLLRSLGFQAYYVAGRVNAGVDYHAWGHLLNLVVIGGDKFLVDVGFGPNNPVKPLKLDKSSLITESIAPASLRLSYKNIQANTQADQRLWVLEHRINSDSEFEELYCFTETEYLPRDLDAMNWHVSTYPKSWFTQQVICSRMTLDKDRIIGVVILQRDIKWRKDGRISDRKQFHCEEDRIKALKEFFGIDLDDAEREGIRGMVSEIKEKGDSL
ncbi:N-terminal acetyltransferase [Madurella fahalii]|uniref:N-terminal acetyltransferase n=1 Tax=Madurella fahalii TaxID=1157608 RepID=A0ABQ0G429_9PEZI